MPIGPVEMAVAAVIVLLLVGPNRATRWGSRLMGTLRRTSREFRDAVEEPPKAPEG